MRNFSNAACFALLALAVGGAAACSSSSSGGADAGHPGDGSTSDATSGACGAVASCYSVDITLSAGSPASCGPGMLTRLADYTALPPDGGAYMPGGQGGCTGTLSGCSLAVDCPNGEALRVTFTDQGLTGTDSLAAQGCVANLVGTRLTACAAFDAGGGGDDGPAVPETGASEAGGPEGGATDATPDAAPAVDGGVDSGVDSGRESGTPDGAQEASGDAAGVEAGAAEAGADATSEAQAPDGGAEAQAEAAPDDGAVGDDGGDGGDDAAVE